MALFSYICRHNIYTIEENKLVFFCYDTTGTKK